MRSPARSTIITQAVRRACRCSQRAERDSRSPGNGSSRCRRWASRPTTAMSTRSWERTAVRAVLGSGARREERLRAHRPQRERGRRCCAGGSTGSRWRSSSPRRECGHCHPRISSPASISGSSSSPGAAAPRFERHQTLRSTIDWSYDLLEPSERRGVGPAVGLRRGLRSGRSRSGPRRRRPRRSRCGRRVGPARRQVARRRRHQRRRAGCATGCSRASASTPRSDSKPGRHRRGPPPPRRPLRRAGRDGRPPPAEPGPARVGRRRRTRDRQLPCRARLGRRDPVAPNTHSAWSHRSP